jgi:hypothetical protein
MSGNLLVRFDEGRVGRISMSPSLLLYRETEWFPDGPSAPRQSPACLLEIGHFRGADLQVCAGPPVPARTRHFTYCRGPSAMPMPVTYPANMCRF